jgi:hypothetical protein
MGPYGPLCSTSESNLQLGYYLHLNHRPLDLSQCNTRPSIPVAYSPRTNRRTFGPTIPVSKPNGLHTRTFPFLQLREIEKQNPKLHYPEHAIEYVGFDVQRKQFGGAYLSARYESLKDDTDFTLQRYLTCKSASSERKLLCIC